MIVGIYAVKDIKSGAFWKPFCQVNDQVAVRELSDMVNSDDRFMIRNYPDLDLYRLGDYDDQSGLITSNVVFICNGSSVKEVSDNE